VISSRLSDMGAGDDPASRALEVQSNTITLRIVPADAPWQQAQLKQALAALAQGWRTEVYSPHDPYWEGLAVLRYLGSETAARELTHRLRGDNNHTDWQCMFGLIGSPYRQAGLKQMDKLLYDPQNHRPERKVRGRVEEAGRWIVEGSRRHRQSRRAASATASETKTCSLQAKAPLEVRKKLDDFLGGRLGEIVALAIAQCDARG
jgi:hypothetical protein